MSDLAVTLRLKADGSGLVGEVRVSKEELARLGQAGAQAGQQGARGLNQTQAAAGTLRNEFAQLTRQVLGYAAGALAIRQVIRATVEQEDAIANLDVVARNAGKTLDFTTGQLHEMAGELQRTTRFSDEAALGAQALFVSMGLGGREVLPRLLKTSADLAQFWKTDLSSTAGTLAKALTDPEQGLAMLNRTMRIFTNDEIKALTAMADMGRGAEVVEIALGRLDQRTAGLAETSRQTLGGALDGLKHQFGELLEGKNGVNALTGGVNDLAKTLADPAVVQGFQHFTGSMLGALGYVAEKLADTVIAFKDAAEFAAQVVEGLPDTDGSGDRTKRRLFNAATLLPSAQLSLASAIVPGVDFRNPFEVNRGLERSIFGATDAEKTAAHAAVLENLRAVVQASTKDFGEFSLTLEDNEKYLARLADAELAEAAAALRSAEARKAAAEAARAKATADRALLDELLPLEAVERKYAERVKQLNGIFPAALRDTDRAKTAYKNLTDARNKDVAAIQDQVSGLNELKAKLAEIEARANPAGAAQSRYDSDIAALQDALGDGLIDESKFMAQAEFLKTEFWDKIRDDGKEATQAIGSQFDELADLIANMGTDSGKAFSLVARGLGSIAEGGKKTTSGYAQMAAGAALFFSEGSRGYKTMMAVSQAFHAVELALTLAELGPKAVSAILGQGQGDPYSAFGRMAAMAAIVGGLGVAVGGVRGGGARITAEDRQRSQGVGSVMGDATAKSESIAGGLEALIQLEDAGLSVSLAQLRQLELIALGFTGVTNQLFRNAAGTGGGATPFNLGASVNTNRVADTFSGIGNLGAGLLAPLTFGIPALGKLIGSVLGKTKTQQVDSGLLFDAGQTFADVLEHGIDGVFFATIEITKRRLGRSTRRSYQELTQDLGGDLVGQFTDLVTGIGLSIVDSIGALGLDDAAAMAQLEARAIGLGRISLQGLSPEDAQKEIEAVFGKFSDDIVTELVPAMADFQQAGEGLYETLLRISAQTTAFIDLVADLGFDFQALASLDTAFIADELIGLAGGVEQFGENIGGFVEGFFSEAERFDLLGNRLNRAAAAAGFALPDTAEGFRALVNAQDLATEAGREMFTVLTSLAPQAAEYYDGLDQQARDAAEASERLAEGVREISETLRREVEAIARVRTSVGGSIRSILSDAPGFDPRAYARGEVQRLGGAAAAARGTAGELDAIGDLQSAIVSRYQTERDYVMQQMSAARSAHDERLNAARQAHDQQMQQYQRVAEALVSLRGFVDGLMLSDISPLTAEQRLREAQGQYGRALLGAQAGDVSAIENLPGLAEAFLKEQRGFDPSDFPEIFEQVTGALRRVQGGGAPAAFDEASFQREWAASEAQFQADLARLQSDALLSLTGIDERLVELDGIAREQFALEFAALNGQLMADTESIVLALQETNAAAAEKISSDIRAATAQARTDADLVLAQMTAASQQAATDMAALCELLARTAAAQQADVDTRRVA